jgi:hypothetical protein
MDIQHVIDPSPRSRPLQRWRRVALFILLDFALLGTLIAVVVPPRLCLITEPERHGLACDVPLPPTAVFEHTVEINGEIPPGVEVLNLQFQVRDATSDEVRAFYLQQLPLKGWACAKVENAHIITSHQGNRELSVVLMPPAETGGRVLMNITMETFTEGFLATRC